MANLKPIRELTATQLILLSGNIPEKWGGGGRQVVRAAPPPPHAAIDHLSIEDSPLHSNASRVKTFLDRKKKKKNASNPIFILYVNT